LPLALPAQLNVTGWLVIDASVLVVVVASVVGVVVFSVFVSVNCRYCWAFRVDVDWELV
jgi:hypothetical protein